MVSWSFVYVNCWGYSEGCSYGQQVIGSCITTTLLLMHHVYCRVFSLNMWSPRWLRPPPPSPDLVPYNLWIFRKRKSFEMEEISDPQRDSGKYDRADDGYWESCVRAQGACFEGDWAALSLLWSNDSYTLCLQCGFKWHFVHWPFKRSSVSPASLPW